MFLKENRYVTSGINERIDLSLQILLWNLVKDIKIQKDFLQVFNLSREGEFIIIEHSQETPEYKSVIRISAKDFSFQGNAKIYAIDSVEYSTLLLSEEY